MRRNALKKWGIESVDDLTEKAGGLWCYLTNDWFSLRRHDNERQNRRTVLPWWQSVQNSPKGFGEFRNLEKPIPKDRLGSLDWFVSHIGGCLTSYAARRGISSLDEAMDWLQRDMGAYWFERDFKDVLQPKILKLGNDLKEKENDDEESD